MRSKGRDLTLGGARLNKGAGMTLGWSGYNTGAGRDMTAEHFQLLISENESEDNSNKL